MKQILDLQKLITFRHLMHQNPEASLKEFQTQKNVREFLIGLNIKEDVIKVCGTTGLIVDLSGEAEKAGDDRLIAFRADIDALVLNEANEHLPYRSTNGCAHMCGHDGHTTCLLAFAQIFQHYKNTIPKNKTVRLLFQPAEEDYGGSVDMIRDGCLENVQEVYGFHQWPTAKIGQVWCKEGSMMSQPIQMQFDFVGKGGHASEPHKFNNPVQCAAEYLYTIHNQLSQEKGQFTFAWTCFNGGTAFNVIPDTATVKGMIRSLEAGLGDRLFNDCCSVAEKTCQKYGCSVKVQRQAENYPLTANHPKEAQHILRLGEKYFGAGNAHAGPCPVYASEDFGNYTLKVPGAFFFLSSGKNDTNNPMLHQSNFDFNDDLIELGAGFWWEIAKDRLLI
ncbi:unnamed protein product [Paramecium primaurelia]|uniref:Peptidase M20 dimerisation domain-containing protein n=1 Tax=Paramecium primaurelia TaxID=5886 RepID=A0A8S1ME49_PARPR|nr:unnamed protein product [Paramecium primaurelia]